MRTQRGNWMRLVTVGTLCGVLLEPRLLHSQHWSPASERERGADVGARHPNDPNIRDWRRALVATTGQIASTPAAYYDRRVNVQATVAAILGPTLFTLDEDVWLAGPDVVVRVEPAKAITVAERSRVTVIGIVRERLVPDIRLNPPWLDDEPARLQLERRPLIEAEAVRLPGGRTWSRDRDATFLMETTAGQIAATPSRFYDQFVRVEADVDQVWSPHTFSLDEDRLFVATDLLVLNPAPRRSMTQGQPVVVIGRVRPLIERELARDFDWFNPGMIVDPLRRVFDNRPVVLAHSVQSESGEELVSGTR